MKLAHQDVPLTAEVIDCIIGAHVHFGDIEKVSLWFRISNPELKGLSPIQMIQYGRAKKLQRHINEAIELSKEEL